jgi:RNA polymerase sigma-70 factor (ECF subfamily)
MTADEEIAACVRAQYQRLVGVVSVVTGSHHLAEEAVQEAFARAWERARKGYQFDHLAGWVATVALNQARSGRRRAASEQAARARLTPVTGTAPDPDVALVVRDVLAGLPARQRDAVVLFYLFDLDVATTAQLLKVSDGTVKSALSRAREKLAPLLRAAELEA